jgi:hypothetical protein
MTIANNSSANVATMGGFNEPPVIAPSPFVNIMIDKHVIEAADRQ